MADVVKPTPTQEENDLAAMGQHVHEKEPDGSPPDHNVEAAAEAEKKRQEKTKEATESHSRRRSTYQTRHTTVE